MTVLVCFLIGAAVGTVVFVLAGRRWRQRRARDAALWRYAQAVAEQQHQMTTADATFAMQLWLSKQAPTTDEALRAERHAKLLERWPVQEDWEGARRVAGALRPSEGSVGAENG